MLFFRLLVAFEKQIDCRRVGEFRSAAEAAIFDVEELGDGFDLGVNDAEIEIGAGAGKGFGLGDGIGELIS